MEGGGEKKGVREGRKEGGKEMGRRKEEGMNDRTVASFGLQ